MVEKIRPNKPDIIITDIYLNGENSLAYLTKMEEVRDIPVIITSAFHRADIYEQAKQLFICSYLIKPIEKFTLLTAVNSSINNIVQSSEKRPFLMLKHKRDF